MRWMNSPPFFASRTAEVATARKRVTPWRLAIEVNLWSASMPWSMADWVRRPVVRLFRPRRTISFARSSTMKCPSGRASATIMWIELLPTSIAVIRTRGE